MNTEGEEKLGKALLVEVGMSYVEEIIPSIRPRDYDHLASTLTEYFEEKKTYEEASALFTEVIGRDDPLVRVKEILSITDEPIAYSKELEKEDSQARRKTRTWGSYEDQRLIAGVYKFGTDKWREVAAFVGNGRTRAQCTQRWARGLNPKICKKHWTPAEDEQLKRLVQMYGEKSWTKIAAALGNRCDVQCRYHYRQLIKGDEPQRNFMGLGNRPMSESASAFFTPQYQPIMPQPIFIPNVMMQDQVMGEVPAQAPSQFAYPMRLSYTVLPTVIPKSKPATTIPLSSEIRTSERTTGNSQIDTFLSHFNK